MTQDIVLGELSLRRGREFDNVFAPQLSLSKIIKLYDQERAGYSVKGQIVVKTCQNGTSIDVQNKYTSDIKAEVERSQVKSYKLAINRLKIIATICRAVKEDRPEKKSPKSVLHRRCRL